MGHAQPIQQAPGHPRFPCVTLSTNKQMKVKAVYKKKSQRTSLTAWNRGKKQVIKVHISWLCLWSMQPKLSSVFAEIYSQRAVVFNSFPDCTGNHTCPVPCFAVWGMWGAHWRQKRRGVCPFLKINRSSMLLDRVRGSGRVALTLPSSVSCQPFSPLLACSNSRPWAVDARVSTGCPSLPFCAGSSPQIPQCDSAAMGEST